MNVNLINRDLKNTLFYYRDKSKHEVDVLRLFGDKAEAYEIKSSKTYSTEMFDNINYLKPLLKERLVKSMVIYDGDQENLLAENGFFNFRHLKQCITE